MIRLPESRSSSIGVEAVQDEVKRPEVDDS